MGPMPGMFSTVIPRNSVIPISRSQVYFTSYDNQDTVEIEVSQGENMLARENVPLGTFRIEGLPPRPAQGVQVEVHFDFDHNGILTVTATEKGKGNQSTLIVDDAATSRLSSHELTKARADIESLFEFGEDFEDLAEEELTPAALMDRAYSLLETLKGEEAETFRSILTRLEAAIAGEDEAQIVALMEELADLF
jgi:molecular chaperone DnaK